MHIFDFEYTLLIYMSKDSVYYMKIFRWFSSACIRVVKKLKGSNDVCKKIGNI